MTFIYNRDGATRRTQPVTGTVGDDGRWDPTRRRSGAGEAGRRRSGVRGARDQQRALKGGIGRPALVQMAVTTEVALHDSPATAAQDRPHGPAHFSYPAAVDVRRGRAARPLAANPQPPRSASSSRMRPSRPSALDSIWRTRSGVIPSRRPISRSGVGSPPSIP